MKNENCPYCHESSCSFTPVNPILLEMIRGIQFFCRFHEADDPCNFAGTPDELVKHEAKCKCNPDNDIDRRLERCVLCNEKVNGKERDGPKEGIEENKEDGGSDRVIVDEEAEKPKLLRILEE